MDEGEQIITLNVVGKMLDLNGKRNTQTAVT